MYMSAPRFSPSPPLAPPASDFPSTPPLGRPCRPQTTPDLQRLDAAKHGVRVHGGRRG